MTPFAQLGLSDEIIKAITELGFNEPSKIQQEAIPHLLEGQRDFIGLAQTGTGKTGAFGLPLVELIDPFLDSTQALILAPTRELGQQIAGQIDLFSKYLAHLEILAVYGGAPINTQLKALRSTKHIIIATPGRLLDLLKRKAIKLNQIRFLILDEADEMLNMGFKEEIDKILQYMPRQKKTWLFSATMPNSIKSIVEQYMENPVRVKIDAETKVNSNIDHQYIFVNKSDKTEVLSRLIDQEEDMTGIVFCRTKRDTQDLSDSLNSRGYKVDAIHGDLSQAQRDRVMGRFRSGELQMLIATDVAARGIDVSDLSHIIHHGLPDDLAFYTHRSGRTARAGKEGVSLILASPQDRRKVERIAKQLKITFTEMAIPDIQDVLQARLEKWCVKVLMHSGKKKKYDKLVDYANMVFGNLSKQELINKIVNLEIEKLDKGADITPPSKKSRKSDGRKSGGRRGSNRGSGSRGKSSKKDYRKFKKKPKGKKRRN